MSELINICAILRTDFPQQHAYQQSDIMQGRQNIEEKCTKTLSRCDHQTTFMHHILTTRKPNYGRQFHMTRTKAPQNREDVICAKCSSAR